MDWAALAAAATPIVVILITFLVERRPSVRAYFGNISSFTLRAQSTSMIGTKAHRRRIENIDLTVLPGVERLIVGLRK